MNEVIPILINEEKSGITSILKIELINTYGFIIFITSK